MFILLVDYDGQAGADLYAIDGEMGGQHDVKAAAKNDVIRMDGPPLPTTTELGICVEVNP